MKQEVKTNRPHCPLCGKPLAFILDEGKKMKFTCITVDCPIEKCGYLTVTQTNALGAVWTFKDALVEIMDSSNADTNEEYLIARQALEARLPSMPLRTARGQ